LKSGEKRGQVMKKVGRKKKKVKAKKENGLDRDRPLQVWLNVSKVQGGEKGSTKEERGTKSRGGSLRDKWVE